MQIFRYGTNSTNSWGLCVARDRKMFVNTEKRENCGGLIERIWGMRAKRIFGCVCTRERSVEKDRVLVRRARCSEILRGVSRVNHECTSLFQKKKKCSN